MDIPVTLILSYIFAGIMSLYAINVADPEAMDIPVTLIHPLHF
jgi:hypothetical protein